MKSSDTLPSNLPVQQDETKELVYSCKGMTEGDLRGSLKEFMSRRPGADEGFSRKDFINELNLYQVELEMQNRELRSSQEVLEESRSRYAELYDYAPVGYLTLDSKGDIQEINLTAAFMLGRERDRIPGTPFSTFLTKGQSNTFFTFLRSVADCKGPVTMETQLQNSSHEKPRDVRFVGMAMPFEQIDRFECQVAVYDITEEKKHQEYFRLHSMIMEQMREGVMLGCQETGTIMETNPAFDKMFGYARGELEGRSIDVLNASSCSCTTPGCVFHEIENRVKQTGYWEGEVENQRKDGSTFWTEASVLAFEHGQYGKVWLTVQRDISARMRLDREVQERNDEIVHMARINTVGELAASLAHELTQPLMAIEHLNHSALQLLQTSGNDAQQEALNLLRAAEQQLQRAGKIIFHLRKFIRKGVVNKRPTSIRDVVSSALGLMQPMFRDQGVTVNTMIAKDLPLLNVEPIQIEQVLINLLRNSVQAMVKAECTNRIINVDVVSGGDKVEVCVSDTGPGLNPQLVERIFDVLESDKAEGMGMGLAISRSLIKAHGGRLWVDTQVTSGAAFCFTLPVYVSETV